MHASAAPAESRPETLVGLRTALLLYALLVITACLTLHGKPLALALIIVLGFAAKSLLHALRERSRD